MLITGIFTKEYYKLLSNFSNQTFKIWFESKFLNVPPNIIDSIDDLIKKIQEKMEFLKKVSNSNAKLQIGDVIIDNKKISIYVGKSSSAYFDDKNNKIIVPYDKNNKIIVPYDDDENKIFQNLLHELIHASDPKYNSSIWAGLSDKYKNLSQPLKTDKEIETYMKEPIEFDAIGSGIAESIKINFKLAKKEEKLEIISQLLKWLRKSNNSDEFPYLNSHAIKIWKSKPTLWRKFQERMWNLIEELKSMK